MRQVMFAAVAASALFAASAASAGTLDFYFTGTGAFAGATASWEQLSNPAPQVYTPFYTVVPISNYHDSNSTNNTHISYGNLGIGGGLGGILGQWLMGPVFYTGTEASPVFWAGSYSMTYNGSAAGTITVTDAQAPGPVPGAGLLSLAFFALVGFGAKARPFLKAAFNRGTRARAPGGGRGSRHRPRRP